MFSVSLKDVISKVVREEVKKKDLKFTINDKDNSITKEGCVIACSCAVCDHNTGKEVNRNYLILFCGNVNVFYTRNDKCLHVSEIPPEQWKNTSNHDSCWSSDGLQFLSKSYFEMCNEVNPNVAPIKLESRAGIGILTLYKKVNITHTLSYDSNDYKYKIIKVEER